MFPISKYVNISILFKGHKCLYAEVVFTQASHVRYCKSTIIRHPILKITNEPRIGLSASASQELRGGRCEWPRDYTGYVPVLQLLPVVSLWRLFPQAASSPILTAPGLASQPSGWQRSAARESPRIPSPPSIKTFTCKCQTTLKVRKLQEQV